MLVKFALSSVTNMLGAKQFLNLTVQEYLWGYEDPLLEFANTVIPSWIDFKKFGIMDRVGTCDPDNCDVVCCRVCVVVVEFCRISVVQDDLLNVMCVTFLHIFIGEFGTVFLNSTSVS